MFLKPLESLDPANKRKQEKVGKVYPVLTHLGSKGTHFIKLKQSYMSIKSQ